MGLIIEVPGGEGRALGAVTKMKRRQRGHALPKKSRRARFELLEPRHLLAAANLAVTTNADVQQMPSVAVDPLDPKHVVVAYMDYSLLDAADNPATPTNEAHDHPYAGIGVATSRDGGASWSYSSVPLPAGFNQGAANSTVKFDNIDHDAMAPGVQNHVFVSFMAATFAGDLPSLTNPDGGAPRALGFEASNGIFVSVSKNGGENWEQPVCASGVPNVYDGVHRVPFDIIPGMEIDNSPTSPRHGTIYVSWSRYFPAGLFPGMPESTGGVEVYISSSTNGGSEWTVKTAQDNGTEFSTLKHPLNDGAVPEGLGYPNWARPSVGPEGDVYVGQFLATFFSVSHSDDGGDSFFVPDLESPIGQPFGIGPVQVQSSFSLRPENQFRTQPSRAIVADPAHPGVVYVADAVSSSDSASKVVDRADIVFTFSTDYGKTWHEPIVVNDDNGHLHPSGLADDVTADQLMVRLSVGPDGKIGLNWLDSRRDSARESFDVFGAIGEYSEDGAGKASVSFGKNFRVSTESFDPANGRFTNALGQPDFYFGDSIGMALTVIAGTPVMYSAWTDTRAGNQNIYFSRMDVAPYPAALNDRFESNNSPSTATVVGPDPVFNSYLPKLNLAAGDEDWFAITPPTGQLSVFADALQSGSDLRLTLYDATGTQVIGEGSPQSSTGGAVGPQIANAKVEAGKTYLVRVHPVGESNEIPYSLTLNTLTANLGEVVHQTVDVNLATGDEAYYLVKATVTGALEATVNAASGSRVELVDLQNPTHVLASSSGTNGTARALVDAGQQLLVHLIGPSSVAASVHVELTNLDQFNVPGLNLLHFPAGSFPSQEAIGDFNRDGILDVAIANAGTNHVSILLGNGDGTFDAPRQFAVGAARYPNVQGVTFSQNGFRRAITADDFDEDGIIDLAMTNYDSADVSVLLGRGDGTFAPHRRFGATYAPFGITVGDVNRDGHKDLVVVDARLEVIGSTMAVLLGRGDGSFEAQDVTPLKNVLADATPFLADLDSDGDLDVILGGGTGNGVDVMKGDGTGAFTFFGHFLGSRQSPDMVVTDINGDGKLDILAASLSAENTIWLLPGNGNGSFSAPIQYYVGQSPISLALVDWGTANSNGSFTGGVPDGLLDVVVANAGTSQGVVAIVGPPEIVVLPNLGFANGTFRGYGAPVQITLAQQPLALKVADFDGDGSKDIGVVDREEFFVVYGKTPTIVANNTRATSRDLGVVVHTVQPTLAITPGHDDAWYMLRVPKEAYAGAGRQVLDFSGGFSNVAGSGLMMEVVGGNGVVRGSGERFRVDAAQDEVLFVHIFGKGGDGTGAYKLVVNTLPQVAGVEAHSLLPGGPTTSVVLVLQGERPSAASAESADNYTVTWLGLDGVKGGGDDHEIPIGENLPGGTKSVIYDPSSNVEVSSGLTYPTAVRQTVTLLFGSAVPPGNYEIAVSKEVVSDSFSVGEADVLSTVQGTGGHTIVNFVGNQIGEGATLTIPGLVQPRTTIGDLKDIGNGTRFFTQFHGDLGAVLDALLSESGDHPTITDTLLQQIIALVLPGLSDVDGSLIVDVAVMLVDPTSLEVVAPGGPSLRYDLQSNSVDNNLTNAFAEVGGNLELIVLFNPRGDYQLNLADVSPNARAGVVHFGIEGAKFSTFTNDLRAQVLDTTFIADSFRLNVNYAASLSVRTFVPFVITVFAATASPAPSTTARFDATQSRFIVPAFNPLLTLATRSASFFASAGAAAFGGGSSSQLNWFNVAEDLLEVVFGKWDGVEVGVGDAAASGNSESADGESGATSFLKRVSNTLFEIIDEVFSGGESGASSAESNSDRKSDGDANDAADRRGQGKAAVLESSSSTGDSPGQAAAQPSDENQSPRSLPSNTSASDRTPDPTHVSPTTSESEKSVNGSQPHATAT